MNRKWYNTYAMRYALKGDGIMGFEPKKLAIFRIWQILKEESDENHPLTQADIAARLERDYGIVIERKAVSRNISMLKEAGVDIESVHAGSYLKYRDFEDSELHMLIDGVLSSKHITAAQSKDLINRICGLSNKYFKSSVRSIYSVNEWNKTDNQELFLNIELIDSAVEGGRRISYDYNKYGVDRKLHKVCSQLVSPYQTILHNQRYYLMAFSHTFNNMVFHRLDRITNMKVTAERALPVRKVPGYEHGIDFKELSSSMPYMYTDKPVFIEFLADAGIIDHVIDWFGSGASFRKCADETKIKVRVKASPNAMEHWAMQYIRYVEITSPASLRDRIRALLNESREKYSLNV